MPIQFNSAGANGLTALIPSGTLGGLLSTEGVVCNDQVHPMQQKGYSHRGPGTTYQMRAVTGRVPRVVDWLWRVRCDTDANMNSFEYLLEQYKADGRAYILEDADGRTGNAVLVDARILHHRRVSRPGRVTAFWFLRFEMLAATLGANNL